GKFQIVFQIAADLNVVRRSTESAYPLRVLLALHEKSRSVRKGAAKKRPKEKSENAKVALVTSERTIRYASAHKNDRHIAAPRFPQKVGPDFRLENDDHR